MTIDDRITAACRRYGAKVTSDAAYAAMSGRPAALAAQGLGDLAGASIALAKLPTGQGPAA